MSVYYWKIKFEQKIGISIDINTIGVCSVLYMIEKKLIKLKGLLENKHHNKIK